MTPMSSLDLDIIRDGSNSNTSSSFSVYYLFIYILYHIVNDHSRYLLYLVPSLYPVEKGWGSLQRETAPTGGKLSSVTMTLVKEHLKLVDRWSR